MSKRANTFSDAVTIRPVEVTDLIEIVALHEHCFLGEDNYSRRLGRGVLRATYCFFLTDSKSFGYVAECDGQLVGYIVGRLDYFFDELNRYRIPAIIRAWIERPWCLFDKRLINRGVNAIRTRLTGRVEQASNQSAPCDGDNTTATLAYLAVKPDYTRLRIADRFLSEAEGLCRRTGMLRLRTDINPSNVLSRFLYRRRGYEEDKSLRTTEDCIYYLYLSDTRSQAPNELSSSTHQFVSEAR